MNQSDAEDDDFDTLMLWTHWYTHTSALTHDRTGISSTSFLTALIRTLLAPLVFYFKSPIRIFRPPRVTTWTIIHSIAQADGHTSLNWKYLRKLVRRDGWRQFVPHHVLPPLLANGVLGFTLFSSYASVKHRITREDSPAGTALVSGAVAGICHSTLASPIDYIRLRYDTRMMAKKGGPQVRSVLSYVLDEVSSWKSIRKTYTGHPITMTRDTVGYAAFFFCFDTWRHHWAINAPPSLSTSNHKVYGQVYSSLGVVSGGMLASFAYHVISYPLDHIRHTIIQKNRMPRKIQLVKPLVTALKSGNLVRSLIPSAIALFCYDTLLHDILNEDDMP